MDKIILENQTSKGERLQAAFLPEKGMNLISFRKGDLEVIEQSTRDLFEERFAGLGALIGPHFHRRRPELVPRIPDETLFPHIARVKAKGIQDPFSHGIARYAPWKAEATATKVKAVLTGKDTWNGVPLAAMEGQNFKIEFEADLQPDGLHLHLSIVSETASLVGIHYYYALPHGTGRVISDVQNEARMQGNLQPIPADWLSDSHRLTFDLNQEADFTFRPHPDPLKGSILLETGAYALRTRYQCLCAENCWQLYHPANAPFVCIEPLSSQDPRHPNLSVSALQIHLEIL
ncbi:hypothetical protein [Candidatus Protochlamydia phocaeensis]|uniref:hypothetical protein n=1 Tax=Candidatus Protochlamydia phocaeensis TaxID=1414722 RepID=UPI0008383A8D|nr:hypothetical protein [Candidatus Protochlamydia phocaeensis]